MVFALEAWTVPGDEEPLEGEEEMERAADFPADEEEAARLWAWERMEEGYAVRLYRR